MTAFHSITFLFNQTNSTLYSSFYHQFNTEFCDVVPLRTLFCVGDIKFYLVEEF